MRGGLRLVVGVVVLALALGIGGGVLIGHFAWGDDNGGSAKTKATPHATRGTAPMRLDGNLAGLGAVVAMPRVHNLFWAGTWNAEHPAFTRPTIATATATILGPTYLPPLAQYGIAGQSFGGTFGSSAFCGPIHAPATVTARQVHDWITCMVADGRTAVPKPRVRVPVSNDLYIAYLPAGTTISDNFVVGPYNVLGRNFGPFTIFTSTSCASYAAYHFFSFSLAQPFAYGVVPAQCAGGSLAGLTPLASHEIVEAITDPLVGAGWIDNSVNNAPPAFMRLRTGEAADICGAGGAAPAGTVSRGTPTAFTLVRFWSNAAGACRPLPP